MKKIIFVNNIPWLESYVKQNTAVRGVRKFYAHEKIGPNALKVLAQGGFSSVKRGDEFGITPEAYARESIDFLGKISKEKSSRLWWATDMASKNRFTSRLSVLLQQYVAICHQILSNQCEELLIVGYDPGVFYQLRKQFEAADCKMICLDSVLQFEALFWAVTIKKRLGIIVNGLMFYGRAILARSILRGRRKRPQAAGAGSYVIKTFVYDSSFDGQGRYRDVFFGRLPEYLKEKENVVIFVNVLGSYRHCLHKIACCSDYSILPIELFVSWGDCLGAVLKLLFLEIRFKDELYFMDYKVRDLVNRELRATVSGIQIIQYLHYECTKRFLREFPADRFLQTYENNPWERMCILAVRENCPAAKIIGFQHTVVPQASLNVFISTQERGTGPLPDRVLTVGQVPKAIMQRYGAYEGYDIQTSCALRHEYIFQLKSFPRKKEGKILMALEGIREAVEMVDYVVAQLGDDTRYQIKVRAHSVLPWSYFEKELIRRKNTPAGVLVSEDTSLLEDIQWADIVVYWGSTVVLEALKMGRPAVHFDNGALLSFDPLFENTYLKWKVCAKDSLSDVIQKIYDLGEDEFRRHQKQALEYIDKYFYPVNSSNIAPFTA